MKVAITPLNPHPNDPEYRVWVGTSNTGLQMFIKNLRVYSNTYP
jgi:hypothetical protein